MRLTACLLAASLLGAAEPPPVAEVDGRPITRRQLEDALLRKEGADLVQELVQQRLDRLDWAGLADGDAIVAIDGGTITRRQLADHLVASKGRQVVGELVELAVVEQALAREGIVTTEALVAGEWARMRRRFAEQQAGKAERVDFDSFIRARERMSPEQFRAQPGFRMLAGIHALVAKRARAEVPEAELRRRHAADPARWHQHPGLDLQVLFMPWKTEPGADGKPALPAGERERLSSVAAGIWGTIARREAPFEQVWAAFGRGWDPEAGTGGRIGWVGRDGRRDQPGSRPVPAEAIERAWDARGALPALVPPVAAADGMWILRVLGRRDGRETAFEEVRERVLADLVEEQLDERTRTLLQALRRDARVSYGPLVEGSASGAATR